MTMKVAVLTKVFLKETNQGTFKHAYQLVNSMQGKVKTEIIKGDSDSFLGKMLFDLVKLPVKLLPAKADVYHAMMPEESIWSVLLNKRPLVTNIYDVLPLT